MGWCAGFLGRTYSTRICLDLYEGALAEAEILIAKHTPADSAATYLNDLSWPNVPLSKTNEQFEAMRSLDLHQVDSNTTVVSSTTEVSDSLERVDSIIICSTKSVTMDGFSSAEEAWPSSITETLRTWRYVMHETYEGSEETKDD